MLHSAFRKTMLSLSQTQGGGGQSAAESAVTGSASAPAASAPGTVESNPVVNAFRDGVTFQIFTRRHIKKKAYSSGGIKNLANTIQLVAKGFSVNDAIGAVASDKASTLLNLDGSVDSQLASLLSAFNADVMAAALGVGGLPSYTSSLPNCCRRSCNNCELSPPRCLHYFIFTINYGKS